MYVFDHLVYDSEIGKTLMAQYTVPDIFSEDLWQLAKGDKNYPPYRQGVALVALKSNVRSSRRYDRWVAKGAASFLPNVVGSNSPDARN